ncbi:MAG: hypothetical protein RIM84_21170 [Alphaproteobacteria bacterium]
MSRWITALALALALSLAAGSAAAQQNTQPNTRLPDRTLPGPGGSSGPTDKSDQLRDRKLPSLQDEGDYSDVPPAQRDAYADYCKTRGGCPGSYAQHQGEFAANQQRELIEQRRKMERDVLRNQRIGVPRTN